MTVQELINKLEKITDKTKPVLYHDDGYGLQDINKVIEKDKEDNNVYYGGLPYDNQVVIE